MTKKDKVNVSVRMPKDMVERLDALCPKIGTEFGQDPLPRSSALLRCLLLGMEQVERGASSVTGPGYVGYAALWDGEDEKETGWVASESMQSLQAMVRALGLQKAQAYVEVRIVPATVDVEKVLKGVSRSPGTR